MIKANAKVTELNKERTHSFTYYFDPDKKITLVEGGFMINNQEKHVEPFISNLGDFFWKFDGIIHDDDEHLCLKKKKDDDAKTIEKIKNYTKGYISVAEKMYEMNKVDFLNFFQVQSKLINFCYTKTKDKYSDGKKTTTSQELNKKIC